MSTLSELSSKADYIASRNHLLKSQWHRYQNSLLQAVSAQNSSINHQLTHGGGDDIRFTLFDHFIVSIHLSDDFFSRDIVYSLNIAAPGEPARFYAFAHAQLNENGVIDGVAIGDKAAVLEHYLQKIAAIYQCLFDALQSDQPIYPQLEKLLEKA